MKRISLAAAALAGYFAAGACQTAHAVDVNRVYGTTNSTSTTPQNNLYNPSLLPGQGYYNGVGNGLGNNDPFFNPNLTYPISPTYPGLGTNPVTPNPTVPNPNPTTYPNINDPNARLRVTTPPGYTVPANNSGTTPKKWRLGVYSKDSDTGVKIHDVVNGGAAHRAGLEVNDNIVAVNGYQVGYVKGQLFDCATEFDRTADQNGWVNLLVQNSRDGKLVNVPVQLDSRLSTLNGSIALQNRQNLPANAIVSVELKEVIGNNANPVTFASTQVDKITQYPIPFSLDYDPAHVSQNGRYLVYASVLVNGREIYRTNQAQPVPAQQGGIRTVALQLDQVQQPTGPYPNAPTVQLGEEAQIAQIVKWFNDYIGRNPSDRELVAYLGALRQGQSMAQIQLSLLANENFFNRCDADKRVYIERMHQMLIGRNPTPEELAYWVARYDAQGGIRRNLAQEFQGALGIY
ncbi:YbaY family lipoprotein [Planctomicrobium sp. SH661]|uniref:YbaY family lipoprotein n=1 Tax=Planctomicrobium sp. SH661 TaxID=3448124 RepID=UPI003F5B275B